MPLLFLIAASPLIAQQPAPVDSGKKPVATINGETVTAQKLDEMYNRMGSEMQDQYASTGGKGAVLENYVRKRLVLQEALKAGFDKRPDVQADMEAARESALFDRYIKDVVAAQYLSDGEIRKFYDAHKDQFAISEKWKVRHIVIATGPSGPPGRTEAQGLELAKKVHNELRQALAEVKTNSAEAAAQATGIRFANLARQYSEDGAKESGGDLGWVVKGQLDSDFETAALALKPGTSSGIVKTRYGYHLIYLEGHRPGGTMSLAEATPRIREALLSEHGAEIIETLNKLTNELRLSSRISVYPENIR